MSLGNKKLGFAEAVRRYGDQWPLFFALLPDFDLRQGVEVNICKVDHGEARKETASVYYRIFREHGKSIPDSSRIVSMAFPAETSIAGLF